MGLLLPALLLVSVGLKHKPDTHLVLGAGWVGSRLAKKLIDRNLNVAVTNRPGFENRLKEAYFEPVPLPSDTPRIQFDINEPHTWEDLPDPQSLRSVVVTFAHTPAACEAFWERYLCHVPYVLAYSSTGVYRVDSPRQIVTEMTPLCESSRALADQYLQDRGATVLTISGIFGEPRGARGVCRCLAAYTASGGALNARKAVNMVHVDDIIEATLRLIEFGATPSWRGERINVGGHTFLLRDLLCHCKYPPATQDLPDTDPSSKRVSSERLLREIMPEGYIFAQPLENSKALQECV